MGAWLSMTALHLSAADARKIEMDELVREALVPLLKLEEFGGAGESQLTREKNVEEVVCRIEPAPGSTERPRPAVVRVQFSDEGSLD